MKSLCYEQVHFYKIDIDLPEVQGVAAKFDISSVVRYFFNWFLCLLCCLKMATIWDR